MESKERRFHHNIHQLSKKELQDLCRTYGLSPYKTKPNLVNSLISYFKVIDTNLLQGYGIRNSAQTSSKRRGTSRPGYVCQRDENDFKHKVDYPHIISFEKSNFSFVREIELGDMSRNRPGGSDSLTKNVVASAVKPTPVPSFEFSVRCDEGINLIVDLNSSPSDWSSRLEKGICLCHSFCKGKLQSICEEHRYLENGGKPKNSSCNVSGDLDGKMKSDLGCTGPSPNTLDNKNGDAVFIHPAERLLGRSKTSQVDRENVDAVFLPPAADNGSTRSCKTKPCAVAMDMPMKENKEFPHVVGVSSGADNQIVSRPKSSLMDGEAGRTDLNDLHACKEKQDCCPKSNLLADVPANGLKGQNIQISEDSMGIDMLNTRSLENPSLVSPVSPVIGAIVVHSSEKTCLEQGAFLSIVDAGPTVISRGDGPANFSEEKIGSLNQKEDSGKLGEKTEYLVPQGHKRKRQDIESEKDHGSPNGRVLRSGKRTHGQVLRRRSTRLVSKGGLWLLSASCKDIRIILQKYIILNQYFVRDAYENQHLVCNTYEVQP